MSPPPPPMAAHTLLTFLLQVGLLLLLAYVLGRLAVRLRMPAVVGELCVGILLGPSILGHSWPAAAQWLFPADLEQTHLTDAVGQIGMLLLVGLTGLHIDPALIRRRGGTAAGVSLGGLVVPLGLGVVAGYFVPGELIPDGTDVTTFALFLGVAMCVSAIPVIARTLLDMNLLHRNVGQLILIAGMVDDAVGWAMLAIVSAMAAGVVSPGAVLLSAASLAGVVLFAFTAGRTLVRLPMRMARRADGPGASVSVVVFLILLSAAGTQALGLEAVFGAFLCGIVISVSGQVPAAGLAPLRTVVLSVFAPIFFAGAGMRMDLTALARPAVLLTGLVILFIAVAGKFVGAFAGARLSRLTRWEAVALGAGLNARGVIEVVVAMVGLRLGILSVEAYTIIVMIAIVTSLMAPPLLRLVMPRIEHTDEEVLREQAHRAWSTTASGTVIPAA